MIKVVGMDGRPSPRAGAPNPQVIEFLHDLLQQAKLGEVQSLAMVWLNPIGEPTQETIPEDNYTEHLITIIGALELCKGAIVQAMLDQP